MSTPSFGKLVRFRTKSGGIYYGEIESQELITQQSLTGLEVSVYNGLTPWDDSFQLTNERQTIEEVLCPLESTPIIHCIGVNYRKHAAETNLPIGPNPVTFIKPSDALAGPFEDIHVNPECVWMDYEGELSFIIGKDCKNATTKNALEYILGYTVGNDVSSRYWQMPERSGHQHGAAKGFDKFAPIGPVIVSPHLLRDPHKFEMRTKVNGVVRQQTNTDDMIFQIPHIIQHLSRGTTLRRGTVVMTGTPSGVAAFMKPQAWLNDGDVVEVEIDGIGQIRNKHIFE